MASPGSPGTEQQRLPSGSQALALLGVSPTSPSGLKAEVAPVTFPLCHSLDHLSATQARQSSSGGRQVEGLPLSPMVTSTLTLGPGRLGRGTVCSPLALRVRGCSRLCLPSSSPRPGGGIPEGQAAVFSRSLGEEKKSHYLHPPNQSPPLGNWVMEFHAPFCSRLPDVTQVPAESGQPAPL